MKVNFFLVTFFLICIHVSAQYYSTGQDPASLRWQHIRTKNYDLIFPEHFKPKAQYLANVLDIICRHETFTLESKVPRIPMVLHTQTVTSNGVTVWAPKRIEMYTCPPQQTYPEEWLEQLAIHEYRHAVQISKINQGFSNALYYVFGEQITGGILGLYVPAWFLEGDATVTETALTKTGRGRSALFESTLRAQIIEKGPYSYDKATLGSYKTFTPDAYSLGYYLVGESRKKYGPELWNTALNRVARLPFMVVPFNSGIRKATGLWKTGLYKSTLAKLDSVWRRQLLASEHIQPTYLTTRNPKNHQVYDHPLFINDSTIVAEKSSMDDVKRFVILNRNTGKEKKLLTPGNQITGTTSVGGGWLAWAERQNDARWANRNFTRIRLYHFRTGKIKTLISRSRYFSPDLSPAGTQLAVVNIDQDNMSSIDIVGVPSGEMIRRYPVSGFGQATLPNWSPDGKQILFKRLSEKGQTIAVLDTATGEIRDLLPASFTEITGQASFFKNYLIYSTNHDGTENIYAMDTLTRKISRVTTGQFAAYDPDFSPDQKRMVFSDYNSDGLMVAVLDFDSTAMTPLQEIQNHAYKLYDDLSLQEHANIQDSVTVRNLYKMLNFNNKQAVIDSISGNLYPAKRYSKITHLFNPHSWAPASFDVNNLSLNPGVMLLSQNTLSTMFAGAGWEYDMNEQTGKFYTSLTYAGLYPELTFRFDLGNRAGYARYSGSSELYRFTWQETNLKFGAGIPWNFSKGRYYRYLEPSLGTTFIGVKHNSSTPANFTAGWINTLDYRIAASQYLQSTQKDVFPRFGQTVKATYRHTPYSKNDMGSILGIDANFYFPGIFRHQGTWIYAGIQQRNDKDVYGYSFSNLIAYPRGYHDAYDENLLSLRINYKLPLWYPDFSFGSVIYLKRLKINLFYDWANGWNPGYINNYNSTGCEVTADFHLLRFVAPIEMGLRTIYFPGSQGWSFEFIYAISY